jgi:tetratricopeptide (TPR) repeat protein
MWLGAALLNLGRTDEAMAAIREAIRIEPDNGQAHQALARAFWVGKGDFASAIPEFERAIELNPEAGYSYLQLGLLLAWEGQYARAEEVCRRAVELQDQYISGNAGLQVVGANSRLGYVYYLQGRYEDALRAYERGLSFVASSDHALKDRTAIELNVKMGAAHHRQGRTAEATRHFQRAVKQFDSLIGKGADDPFTRYYVACVHALSGATDLAFDSLQRVAARLPALTAARIPRDPDVESLRTDPRFEAITSLRVQ